MTENPGSDNAVDSPIDSHSRVNLWVPTAGAIAGLVLAGYALFTAPGTSTLHVPADAVATVNQQPISRLDFNVQLQALFSVNLSQATAEQKKKILTDMIREELLVQRGLELDVAQSDPEVRSALVNAVENEVAADALTAQPTQAQLESYYDKYKEKYSTEGMMTVRAFLIGDRRAAQTLAEVQKALRENPRTTQLSNRSDIKESALVGDEQFYFAAKVHLGEALFRVARGLSDGQISEPVASPDGLHVLAMIKNETPRPQTFVDARDRVLNDYRNERVRNLRAGNEEFLRKRAHILYSSDMP